MASSANHSLKLSKRTPSPGMQENKKPCFNNLNKIMTRAPILALPNYKEPFTLEADACGYVIGASP
jgi:hypothetical protein